MHAPQPQARPAARDETPAVLFAGLLGLLLGVGLLKFGNPVILDRLVGMPANLDEWRAFSWPVRVGHVALAVVTGISLWTIRSAWRPRGPVWASPLLLAWLAWQFVAAAGSVDPAASRIVVVHFVCCVVCYFLGNLALPRVAEPRIFWLCVVAGFVGALGMAIDQRFGGLEATRKIILQSPDATSLPPEYLARIRSNRVFGTLVYPNALAGAILLLLPPALVLSYRAGRLRSVFTGQIATVVLLVVGLAVLVWSGSKAGWLIALSVIAFLLLHAPVRRRWKVGAVVVSVTLGLAGFGWMFRDKLRAGATSVAARFDYWSGAWHGFLQRPVVGNGPGAFRRIYSQVKNPESEMAQLAHNDYLQQAVDSGLPGFLTYFGFIWGALWFLYRNRDRMNDGLQRAVWVGLAAWFTQGFVEFGLYLPATAWCAFALLGWLLAQKPSPSHH